MGSENYSFQNEKEMIVTAKNTAKDTIKKNLSESSFDSLNIALCKSELLIFKIISDIFFHTFNFIFLYIGIHRVPFQFCARKANATRTESVRFKDQGKGSDDFLYQFVITISDE